MPVDSVLELIGDTPVVRLRKIGGEGCADIYVKLESFNPGYSVKDRLGEALIRDGESRGVLKPGGTIIEPTAGNTGIGVALAGVQHGYRVILVVPENFSAEKRELMAALGGEVVLTPAKEGMKYAIAKAEELARSIEGAWVPQQFKNPANGQAHYDTTGPEIFEQMEGRLDAFVAGAGSGGTFSGCSRYLKEKIAGIECILVEPQGSVFQGGEAGPHEVEGIGSSYIPESLDIKLADEIVMIHDEPSMKMVARLAREEGILAGSSAGAAVCAAVGVAQRLGPGKRVLAIVADSAERYLSKGIFSKWRD
jgi:O-acetylserine dependent cystathionine beta-synthase